MTFAIPAVGSDIEVCMANPLMPTARYPGEPDCNWYRGKVLKSLNWMTGDMFCLSTDNRESPVRVLDKDRVLELRLTESSVEVKENSNFHCYQVDGSKGSVYNVINDSSKWTCDCPAFSFRKGKKSDCKHIKKIQEELNG
jgi:hypothetical protein